MCYLRRFGAPVWACIDLPLSHVCSIVPDIADFLHAIEVQAGFFGTSLWPARCEVSPPALHRTIPPMPKLADQFFNESTGVGDYGDRDTRSPWNEGEDWDYVESLAIPDLRARFRQTARGDRRKRRSRALVPHVADPGLEDSLTVPRIDPKRLRPALSILISHTRARRAPRLAHVSVRARQRRSES